MMILCDTTQRSEFKNSRSTDKTLSSSKMSKLKKPFNHQTLVIAILFYAIALFINSLPLLVSADEDVALQQHNNKIPVNRFIIMTVASNPNNEGFKRFNRSIESYGLELIVLGSNEKLDALIPQQQPQLKEIDLYKKALSVYKNEQNLVIMVVDSANLIINGDKKDILQRFAKFNSKTRVVFAADSRCWPDSSLESKYPPMPISGGERFLLSAAFIGYAPALWDLVMNDSHISNEIPQSNQQQAPATTDAQLYFTNVYLNSEMRSQLGIELDHRGELFQNLHSIESDVELEFDADGVKLKNLAYLTEPVVVYGTGASRVVLNSLGNYLGRAWTMKEGCRHCNESMISLAFTKDSDLPTVLIGLFIEEPTPFLDEFFDSVLDLSYPKNKLHLFVHSAIKYHDEQLRKFEDKLHSSAQYLSQQVVKSYDDISNTTEALWRTYALDKCVQLNCEYYLALDSVARLDLPESLRLLIEANKTIVAPLLTRPTKLWSNFWGSMTPDGYYARSHDYVELVKRERVGLWNVPHVMNAYLIEGKFIRDHMLSGEKALSTIESELDLKRLAENITRLTYYEPNQMPTESQKAVLVFSQRLRSLNVFQYMLNTHEFGHLADPTTYNISLKNPDFYQLKHNMLDWEQRYLHDNYSHILENDTTLEQPCQDVFWFPLVNDLFCKEMIEIMENFGEWSGGTNHDPRIEGGYESVPTRDIHMKQVGLHELWLLFLREYVMPVQLKEYIGYEHDPPRADLAFVVRYHPAEQASLRPHHDSSTYTLNIALNSPHEDYEGGGCRFARYNCSVTDSRKGWALIHPGRLTHYHEGLPVTKGTRYIMVTFVDP